MKKNLGSLALIWTQWTAVFFRIPSLICATIYAWTNPLGDGIFTIPQISHKEGHPSDYTISTNQGWWGSSYREPAIPGDPGPGRLCLGTDYLFHQYRWHDSINDHQDDSMSKDNITRWYKTCTYISWEVSFSILQMSSCHVTCDSFYLTLTQLKSHQFRKTAIWIHYELVSCFTVPWSIVNSTRRKE